eukprot:gb/GFBE01021771.1/.p1 GENE.gb/GFBE01021771.1/~~gb/GFBE01021771.1/.p1  ORF type:complete len:377 (+),score=99.42 gb/GFBE01021771.1/:1-1131(+)
MTGKDTRNRNTGRRAGGRKGSYPGSWEAAQQGPAVGEAVVPGLVHSANDGARWMQQEKAKRQQGGGSQEFLARLPTPSRAPEQAYGDNYGDEYAAQQDHHRHHNQYQQPHGHMAQHQLDHMSKARSEPWNALPQMMEEVATNQPQPSYRELLQARGQQAMQRTMTGGGGGMTPSNMSPTASVASPTTSPHNGQILSSMAPTQQAVLPPLPPLPMSAPTGPDPMMHWAQMPQQQMQPMMQQPWCTSPGPMDMPALGPNAPVGQYQQQVPQPMLPPAALRGVPPLDEVCGQHSPVMSMMAGCGMAPMANMNAGQVTPSTAAPSPVSPAMPQMPITPGSDNKWDQQEIVAQIMPGLLNMDKEQLAQQLRDAAAHCVYDD